MMTHLKYLAVGGAMILAVVCTVAVFNAVPMLPAVLLFAAGAYCLGWAYYYHRSGQ